MTTIEAVEKGELIQCPTAIAQSFGVERPCFWSPDAWDKLGFTTPLQHIGKAIKTHPDHILFKRNKRNTLGIFKAKDEAGNELEYHITFGWSIEDEPIAPQRIITVHFPGE